MPVWGLADPSCALLKIPGAIAWREQARRADDRHKLPVCLLHDITLPKTEKSLTYDPQGFAAF